MAPTLADVLAAVRELRPAQLSLLNAEQAGELLNVPASWLLAQARKDRIPHVKLGHYTRFERERLLDWARNGGTQ